MNYKLMLLGVLICSLSLGLLSCDGNANNQDATQLFDTASSETWNVGYFFNDAADNKFFLKD